MNAEMQPLYWRINDAEQPGMEAVSLLMPTTEGELPAEYPTDVAFHASKRRTGPLDLRWSDDDSELFMSLLDRVMDTSSEPEISLDITDDVVQGIVQLVAVARFRTPWPTDEIVGDDFITEREELEVGDLVALNTSVGFPMAIIVAIDSIDATCILLDELITNDTELVPDHSVLVVNRAYVLPSTFADSDNGDNAIVH